MKNKLLISLFPILFLNQLFGNPVTICGKIANYPNKQISLEIFPTDAVWVIAESRVLMLKTKQDGSFMIKLENIEHFMFENKLKIGSEIIYLSFAPGDSIFISMDYVNKQNNLSFSGINAAKNYFMNKFLSDLYRADNKINYNRDWLDKNLNSLQEFTDRYQIEKESKDILTEYISCFYNNQISTSEIYSHSGSAVFWESLDINSNKLAWYHLYYSVISAYLVHIENLPPASNLNQRFEELFQVSERHLKGTIKENYQAYIIGIYLSGKTTRILLKSDTNQEIVKEFIAHCQNETVKKNIVDLLRGKRVI